MRVCFLPFSGLPARPRSQFRGLSGVVCYEYTPFCNGPVDVKCPPDCHAAELTLLSVVDAEAATLCC